MRLRPVTRITTLNPHICTCHDVPFVQPGDPTPHGRWTVDRWCPNCDWNGEALLDDGQLDHFDDQLMAGADELVTGLAELTPGNMREYAECFTAALNANALLPEDF